MRKKVLGKKLICGLAIGILCLNANACGKDEVETTVAEESSEEIVDVNSGEDTGDTGDVEGEEYETDEFGNIIEETTAGQEIKVAIEAAEETTVPNADFVPAQSNDGRWQKGRSGEWTFILNDTNAPAKERAVEMEGTLYYFNADGIMDNEGWSKEADGVHKYYKNGQYLTGWILQNKYYIDPEKGKLTGLCEIEGKKYLMDDEGLAVNGWKEVEGKKYYAEKGILALGIKSINEGVYGFDENGAMQVGECQIGGKRYIFNDDGTAKVGLVDTEKGKVYCDEGEVQTGKVEVNGVVMKFGEDGVLIADTFVNGIYINPDGTADAAKRVTNIGAFADKDGIDGLLNKLPKSFVDEMFTQNKWKLIYDATVKGSMEEIEGSGAVSFSGKFLKFHNLDTVGHRLGHYVGFVSNKASGIKEMREEEFANLGWDEYFGKSDGEYFSEACGKILTGEFDKSKAPKTYEYIASILAERYGITK